MADMLKFRRGSYAQINSAALSNGTIYVATDEKALYVDTATERIRIGDFIRVSTVKDLIPPFSTSSLYYVEADNALLKYTGETTGWKQVNGTDELQNELASLKTTVNSHTSDITALKTAIGMNEDGEVEGLAGTVAQLGADLDTLEGTVKTLSGTVETQGTAIETLQGAVETQGADIEAIDASITAINEDLGELQTALNNHATTAEATYAKKDEVENTYAKKTDVYTKADANAAIEAAVAAEAAIARAAEEANATLAGAAQDAADAAQEAADAAQGTADQAIELIGDEHSGLVKQINERVTIVAFNEYKNTNDAAVKDAADAAAAADAKAVNAATAAATADAKAEARVEKTVFDQFQKDNTTAINGVKTIAEQGVSDAAAAQGTADQAVADAEAAQTTANQAVADAAAANANAETRVEKTVFDQFKLDNTNVINGVKTTAEKGVSDAAAAQTTANKAVADAEAAQTTANQAVSDAAAAQGTANTAVTNAATAQKTIDDYKTEHAGDYTNAQIETLVADAKKAGTDAANAASAAGTVAKDAQDRVAAIEEDYLKAADLDEAKEDLTAYIDNEIDAANAMTYKKTITTAEELPATASIGDTYVAGAAFKLNGVQIYAGDMLIAQADEGAEEVDGVLAADDLVWKRVETGYAAALDPLLNVENNSIQLGALGATDGSLGAVEFKGAGSAQVKTEAGAIVIGTYWEDFDEEEE